MRIIEELLPETIARAKLIDAVGRQEAEKMVTEALKNVTYYVD